MTSELDAGINLIDNCNLSAEDLSEPGNADDILDRHAQPANTTRAESTANPVDADTALADAQRGRATVDDERDDIHEQLEHHHERRHGPRAPVAPRGSADLAATPPTARRPRRPRRSPGSSPGGLRRPRLAITVAGLLAGVALLAGTLLDPASGRHAPTPGIAHQLASDQAPSSDAIRHSLAPAAAALAADARRAAQKAQARARARARAKAAARAKAKTRALAKTRAAARSRAAEARQVTTHPAVVTPTSTPAAASSLTSAAASPSSTETPSTSSGSTTGSTRSSSGTTSSGGSAAAPAGPTGVGSAGSNCNPQCS